MYKLLNISYDISMIYQNYLMVLQFLIILYIQYSYILELSDL